MSIWILLITIYFTIAILLEIANYLYLKKQITDSTEQKNNYYKLINKIFTSSLIWGGIISILIVSLYSERQIDLFVWITLSLSYFIKFAFRINKTNAIKYLIPFIIVSILYALLLFCFYQSPIFFWISLLIFVIASTFFRYYLVIIFQFKQQNQQLSEPERNKLIDIANNTGIKVNNILITMSITNNAMACTKDKKNYIFLTDALIRLLNFEELKSVFLHELCHIKEKDNSKNLIFSLLLSIVVMILFYLFITYYSTTVFLSLNMIFFFILTIPLNFIIKIISNIKTKRQEFRADLFSTFHNDKLFLISALKKTNNTKYRLLLLYSILTKSYPDNNERINKILLNAELFQN